MPDLTNLSLAGIIGLLVILGAVDVVGTELIALAAGHWDGHQATVFLVEHVAKIWFPIVGLAVIGHGIVALDIPAIPLASAGAVGSIVIYGASTIASLKGSFDDRGAPPATPFP